MIIKDEEAHSKFCPQRHFTQKQVEEKLIYALVQRVCGGDGMDMKEIKSVIVAILTMIATYPIIIKRKIS